MKNKTDLLLLAAILLTVTSCYKKKKVKPNHVDIYFVGSSALHPTSSSQQGNTYIATYWKNGVPVVLKGDTVNDSNANGIAVNGSDVYVVGDISVKLPNGNETAIATYWKNGVPNKLGQGNISAIAIKGKDVYMVGSCYYGFDIDKMAIWKNGVLDTVGDGRISSIAIDGDDIYMAGFQVEMSDVQRKADVAVYWKNGRPISLDHNDLYPETMATKVFVKDGDAYMAGFSREPEEMPMYWKNRDSVNLSAKTPQLHGNAYGIYVGENNVYAAGIAYIHDAFSTFKAVYWKNGIVHYLPYIGETSLATDITVINNDLYVAGRDDYPVYWKNGKRVQLGSAKGQVSGMTVVTY